MPKSNLHLYRREQRPDPESRTTDYILLACLVAMFAIIFGPAVLHVLAH